MNQLTRSHDRVFISSLTLSHHRPYDYPPGRIEWPADERRSEYAMAYADWALNRFLTQAAATPWFTRTLFIIAADHGSKFHGAAPIPVAAYRVPLVLYAPDILEPRRLSSLGSIMSLPATLLDLLRIEDSQGFYGASLLSGEPLLVPVEHGYDVGVVGPEQLTVLHRGGDISGWRYQDPRYTPVAPDVRQADRASRLFGRAHAHLYPQ